MSSSERQRRLPPHATGETRTAVGERVTDVTGAPMRIIQTGPVDPESTAAQQAIERDHRNLGRKVIRRLVTPLSSTPSPSSTLIMEGTMTLALEIVQDSAGRTMTITPPLCADGMAVAAGTEI